MKRKIFSLALSLLLCAGMLYGCSQEQAGESSSQASSSPAAESEKAEAKPPPSGAAATWRRPLKAPSTTAGSPWMASKNAFQHQGTAL